MLERSTSGLRLWHGVVAVAMAAVMFTALRFEDPCTPIGRLLFGMYVCAGLGIWAARWQGRRARTGFLLGLLLGPIGVVLAASNRVRDKESTDDRVSRL